MKIETFKKLRGGLVVLVGILMSVALGRDSVAMAILVVISGMILLSLLKLGVKEKLEDERVMGVAEKAARSAFIMLMTVLGITSAGLFIGGRGEFYYVRALGIVLSYVTCLGLVIYSVAYFWFDRRTGGMDEE